MEQITKILVNDTEYQIIDETALHEGDVSGAGVFIAEYGVTSYDDIADAYNSGKAVFCKYTSSLGVYHMLPLVRYVEANGPISFYGEVGSIGSNGAIDSVSGVTASVNSNSVWSDAIGDVYPHTETPKKFIATYGVTTSAEVINAYNNGQRILCYYTTDRGGYVYAELNDYSDDIFSFVNFATSSGADMEIFTLDEADGWEYYETDYAAKTHTHAISEVTGLEARLSTAEKMAADNEIAIENLLEDSETKTDAAAKLAEAKGYTNTGVAEAKSYTDTEISALGALATKDTVAKTDLDSGVQTSLGKADTALQSYTETDPTVPAWAKASTKPSYTASEVGADASGTASSAVSTHNTNTSAHADIRTALDGKANKSEGAFYIEGSGTTDATNKVSTWTGTSDRITEYYDGLTIRYKIGVEGQSTVTLNINNLGAKTVYRFNTTQLTTQFPVGSIIHLIYHADLNDGCWVTNDYDANTNTQQRVYVSTTNKEYPITARYNTTTGSSYYAEYGRYSTGVTLNPSTNTITATTFKGKLTGNADTATKATQDANGNVIADTYETKANVDSKLDEVSSQISQLSSEKVNKNNISLGIASDGLIYIFVDGTPVGTGIPQSTGESGDVFGYVDENNTIVLNGNLADGTYTLKYEMGNGEIVNIGNMVLDSNVYYTITKNLTQCSINNSATQIVEGESYSATIAAKDGYELKSVSVTMGGSAVSVSGGVINIASVTGNIVITAVAEEAVVAEPTNFAEPNTTNTTDWSIWCNNARFGSDGAYRANSGTVVTNYIPMQVGDTLYFEGLSVSTTSTAMTNGLAFYDSSKTSICPTYLGWFLDDTSSAGGKFANVEVVAGAYTFELLDTFNSYQASGKPAGSQTAYVRICGALTGTIDDVVIKVKRNGEWL